MVNGVAFVIFEDLEEDLASGPETSLDHSRAFVYQSFIKVSSVQYSVVSSSL